MDKPHIIFLYTNTPVKKISGKYYCELKNFLDFMIELSKQAKGYRLVIPCLSVKNDVVDKDNLIEIELPKNFIPVYYYKGHFWTILKSFLNVHKMVGHIKSLGVDNYHITVASTGPEPFLFYLSWILPKSIRYACFVRGDKLKIIQHVYKDSPLYYVATNLVKLFRWRINQLLKQKRAIIFLYGSQLKAQFHLTPNNHQVVSALIEKKMIRNTLKEPRFPKDKLKVLYIGRLSPEKNVLALVKACQYALSLEKPFQLTIVGDGPLADEVSELICFHQLEPYVQCLGYIPHGDQFLQYLDSHDLFCLPSFTEGIPRVVIEAFARSLPVISTRVGALSQLFPSAIHFIEGYEMLNIYEAIEWSRNSYPEILIKMEQGKKNIEQFCLDINAHSVNRLINNLPPQEQN